MTSRNLNVAVAPPIRLNLSKFWNNFGEESIGFSLDIWVDELSAEDNARVYAAFRALTDPFLRDQMEQYHERAKTHDLSDEWLSNTELGRRLAESRLRVAAYLERFHHLDALTGQIFMKCSLFIIPFRNREI